MRKQLEKYYDSKNRALVINKSIVRYEDSLWMYHGSWIDPDTGKIKVLLSSFSGGKMRLVHNRHRDQIELEYTMK